MFPNSTTLGAAVAEAVYMAGMEANGDVVQMATYGDLMANTRDDHGSAGTSTILINAAGSFGSPSWVVQKLFMHAQPASLIPSTLRLTYSPAAPPPAGPAIGVGLPGCCGGSHYNSRDKDCDKDGRGMWDARKAGIKDLAGCVAAVAKCAQGNFASFYPPSGADGGSCGWHRSCASWPDDIASCTNISSKYVSARVHNTSSFAGTCNRWTNGGSCNTAATATTATGFGGGKVAPSESAMLAASVSVSVAGEIQAKLINYGTRGASVTVLLEKAAATGKVSWMSGNDAGDVNSFAEPRRVGIQEKAMKVHDGKVLLQLPSWSVSVLTVARG
jgi:hypothetical protein